PLLPEGPQFPASGRHGAFAFVREVDPGLRAEAGELGIVSEPIDSKPVADVIKIDIARLCNGSVERNVSVTAFSPTGEIVTIERSAAGAMEYRLVVNYAGFQAGKSDKRLKRGAGSEFRLGRAVHQGLVRVVHDFFPVFRADPSRELV